MALETQNFEENQEVVAGKEAINKILDNEIKDPKAFTDSVKKWMASLSEEAKKARESKEKQEAPWYYLSIDEIKNSIPNDLSTENIPDEYVKYKDIIEPLLDWKVTTEETQAFQNIPGINKYYPWEREPSGDWKIWPFTVYALINMLWWDLDWYKIEMKSKLDIKRVGYNDGIPDDKKVKLFDWPEKEEK